jgi:hypothetical protein
VSDPAPRPFNAKEVAENIRAGKTVGLGDYVIMKRQGEELALKCRRCEATMSMPYSSAAFALADDAIAFILKHQHREGIAS